MTATEVMVRYELMQRLLGPTLGRLEADYLDPLVKRTLNILHRNKRLPEMPSIVEDLEGQFNIEYTGPLPRAQKQDTSQSVLNWVGVIGQLAEVTPEMLDVMDVDSIARGLGDLSSVPKKFLRSEKEVKKIRKERQEKINTMESAEAARATGEGMEAMGKGREALGGELGMIEQ